MRAVWIVALATTRAVAQPIPGTEDDPIRELAMLPGVVDSPLVEGLAIRGGAPVETVVLFDGFEVPLIDPMPARSVEITRVTGVEYGRGANLVALRSRGFADATTTALQLDTRGLYLQGSSAGVAGSFRAYDLDTAVAVVRGAITRNVEVSGIQSRDTGRGVATYRRRSAAWSTTVAASVLARFPEEETETQRFAYDQTTIDTRVDVERRFGSVAGLANLTWRFGEQTNFARYAFDIAWPVLPREGVPQPNALDPADTSTRADSTDWILDAALWTSLSAKLAPNLAVTAGVRVDAFESYVSTQPRGNLDVKLTADTALRLSAGAYRRPPRELDEILAGYLHPERTTTVTLDASHVIRTGFALLGSLHYSDRTRLIMRDGNGVLGNTGSGTAYGVEASAIARSGPWFASLGTALSSSTRRDFPRGGTRPMQYEQPFKLDAVLIWARARWQLGGRFRVASGLPYTPVQVAIYNSDTDYYEPIFDRTYSARAPLQHRLDLRVDRTFELGRGFFVTAFVDLHNAYASRAPLTYLYSYDYKQRVAQMLPVFPYAGLRGSL